MLPVAGLQQRHAGVTEQPRNQSARVTRSTGSASLTCSPKSFCICWFSFTLQEFLRTKVKTKSSVNTTGTDITACANMLWSVTAAQTKSLTFGPHRSAFGARVRELSVLSVHSQLNWAQGGRLMSDCCQTEKNPPQQWVCKALGGDLVFPKKTPSKYLLVLHHHERGKIR